MPSNKNFILRIMKLDSLFRTGRKYSIDELMEAVSGFLSEKTGKEVNISEKTFRNDIHDMRYDFNAPIEVENSKYFYEDKNFSIFASFTTEDAENLLEATKIFENNLPLPFVNLLVDFTERLVYRSGLSTKYMFFPYVLLEKNAGYKGLKWLKDIYKAIEENQKLYIDYNSFDGTGDFEDVVRPYLLREYRNSWFLIGKPESVEEPFYTIPLDRIHSLKFTGEYFFPGEEKEKVLQDFDEIVGVTYIKENPVEDIRLEFRPPAGNYVLSKPLHHSQRIIEQTSGRLIISLRLRVNYELKQLILKYIPNVRVLRPKYLREDILKMLREGLEFASQ